MFNNSITLVEVVMLFLELYPSLLFYLLQALAEYFGIRNYASLKLQNTIFNLLMAFAKLYSTLLLLANNPSGVKERGRGKIAQF